MTSSTNNFEMERFFQDFWTHYEKNFERKERKSQVDNLESEELFLDFWSKLEPKSKKEKLEQEMLTLKKRELYRQYTSFATMVPVAAFMAIELTSICSGWVLLSIISGALSHVILPFTVLSLVCTLYLIHNNRKIAQKEQELKDLENGKIAEEGEKNVSYNTNDYINCVDAALTIFLIVASVVSEAEDIAFLSSSVFGFIASAYFCYKEYKKNEEYEADKENHNTDKKSERKTNNISTPKLMLASSFVFLIRRIMLMALASSLNPVVGPALGLVGMICLMAGQVLIMCSHRRELTDVKVSGKGASFGASSINSNTRGSYIPEVGGGAIGG